MTRACRIEDRIDEIGIDAAGSLFVKPRRQKLPYIWRSAMEVHWDEKNQRLFAPRPRDWSYLDWFRQILAAAADEYGIRLIIDDLTRWSGIDGALQRQIEEAGR